jgi:hypothetical protein
MTNKYQPYNQKWLAGCGVAGLCVILLITGMLLVIFNQDREAARYPDAIRVSDHTNYAGLPRQFRWDNAYRTTDPFPQVYNWYSTKFDLGAENRANGRCIILEGAHQTPLSNRTTTVSLCNTAEGQLIFISRTTQLGIGN